MNVKMYLEYCIPEIWGIQSSSLNSTVPNPVNYILSTLFIVRYFENTILTPAAPEYEFKKSYWKKFHFLSDCVCARVTSRNGGALVVGKEKGGTGEREKKERQTDAWSKKCHF